ncbi:MAG: polysaccharide deacetylase family protein [Candidatus Latescibacterota bacterium]|nr:polysaccharide deacetylase family protein [Candidatus Latescibacterota bacterium]
MADTFPWPEGKRFALSLSFDDARASCLDHGIPLLNTHGVKATFYVLPHPVEEHLESWRAAAEAGHEMGNHTASHPCSANFHWISPDRRTEDWTLPQMETDLDEATVALQRLLDVTPRSFAYPCGNTTVGRGEQAHSYIPAIAKRFVCGRLFKSEGPVDPDTADLSAVFGVDMDERDYADLVPYLDQARERSTWLVLAGHDMCLDKRQGVRRETLEALCVLADGDAWVAPVADVADHILAHRQVML